MSEGIQDVFSADVVVCQCGADGLANDPMASYNLTPNALAHCVRKLQSWRLPLLLLGGGRFYLRYIILHKSVNCLW